jgi:Tfp pilus assembly protein PilW
MMIALVAGLIILSATMDTTISIQRLYAAVEDYSTDEGSQRLISDYISMDLRRCLDVTSVNNVLTMTIPDYYSNSGAQPSPNAVPSPDPTVVGNNVSYSGGNVTVTYYLQGSSFIREVPSGTKTSIADNVADFSVVDQDLTTAVTCAITFQPRFTRTVTANGTAGTKVYTKVYLRNTVARH